MSKKILVVQDDRNFGYILPDYLSRNNFEVTFSKNGMEGFEKFKRNEYGLCIIDITMPFKDGYTLTKEIRAKSNTIPIIFILAEGMGEEVLKGYKANTDDFVNKPFEPEEVLKKIRAIIESRFLKEKTEMDNFEFKIGKFDLNSKHRLLRFPENEPIRLSPKENELLKMLALHENSLMARELALVKIWRDNNYFTSRSMDVYIAKLRKYLKADQNVEIRNVPSKGFKLTTEKSFT